MKQNLIDKIYCELDMIRFLSKISGFAIDNNAKNLEYDCFKLVFEDIEKRCWEISETIEKLNLPMNEGEGF